MLIQIIKKERNVKNVEVEKIPSFTTQIMKKMRALHYVKNVITKNEELNFHNKSVTNYP